MNTYTDDELDEMVHECFSDNASDLNNQGREAQEAFLTEQGVIDGEEYGPSLADFTLMSAIAERAIRSLTFGVTIKKLDIMMDLEYAHDEAPMDLTRLLGFADSDFNHDMLGIYHNFNRTTLRMDNAFSPRCTKSTAERHEDEGTEGQDRDNYTDEQDRDNYTVEETG